MSRPRRVLGYARVSSAAQALGSSLGDQQAAISAYASSRGLSVAKFYVEAESSIREKLEARKQIQALLRDARAGDLILCAKLDRWSRDPEFTYKSIREMLASGVSFYAVDDQCDPSTSEGDTMLNFRVLFAREEHKRIRQRTIGTRNLLRDKGYYVEGRTPIGYRRAHPKGYRGVDKNVLVVIPEEAEMIRSMFALCIAGRSLSEIAEELGTRKDRVQHSLSNRHYLGELRDSKGQWMKGPHESLVSPETFRRARAALESRRLTRRLSKKLSSDSETWTWILRDVARCAKCGGKMSAAYGGPKGPQRKHYYRCWHRCRSLGNRATNGAFVPVRDVEALAAALVVERLVELREEIGRGAEPRGRAKVVDFEGQRRKIEKLRSGYLESHAEGLMTIAELRVRLEKLERDRGAIDAKEAELARENALIDPHVRRAALREVDMLEKAWRRATPALKRDIVNRLALAVRIERGADPIVVWTPVADLVAP